MKKVLYGLMVVAVLSLAAVSITVLADVGDLSVTNVADLGDGNFTASGTWSPQGNQCWNNGQGFHYYIQVFEDLDNDSAFDNTDEVLQTIEPAPCDGVFSGEVTNKDVGGDWPADGQNPSPSQFNLDEGEHTICAVLFHVNEKGGDTATAVDCFGSDVVVYACSDGVDNDDSEDALADELDPGCWTDPNDLQTYNAQDDNETLVDACPNDAGIQTSTEQCTPPPTPPQCSDDVDNNDAEDTLADELDPGCWTDPNDSQTYNPEDDNETLVDICPNDAGIQTSTEQCTPPPTPPQCSDDIDNTDEEDTLVDELDPGCWTNPNNSETYNSQDDNETLVDACPNDAGIQTSTEQCTPPPTPPQCDDGVDNDDSEDALADELDPGCWTDPNNSQTYDATDDNETLVDACPNDAGIQTSTEQCTPPPQNPECSDNEDNSDAEDTLADELDPGCWNNPNDSGTYNSEDDNETLVDACPNDSGIQTSTEECTPPQTPPECSDDSDNDNDNLTDYPSDPGCDSPEDNDETNNEDNSNRSSGGSSRRTPPGEVLGAATEICNVVDTYMRRGYRNVSDEVQTLQNFLNAYMQSGLIVDSVFGGATEAAVKAFQLRQRANVMDPWGLTAPTGIFYKTSLAEAKRLMCPEEFGALPIPTDLIPWSKNPTQVPPKAI